MVSLNRRFDTSTGGGVFFNDNSVSDDERQRLQPILGGVSEKLFEPLKTVPVSALHIFLSVVMAVGTILLALLWPDGKDRCAPFFIILYVHAVFWCFSVLADSDFKKKHHNLRVNGYLEFYRQTHHLIRMPCFVASGWNTILLVASTYYYHHYEEYFREQCMASGFSKPVYPLCVAVGLEAVLVVCAMIFYIRKVIQFNRSKPPPDVLREEWMISFIQDSYSYGEVGYREHGDHIHDLLEKQADLIRYLIDRNVKLSQKILTLSSQVHGEQS